MKKMTQKLTDRLQVYPELKRIALCHGQELHSQPVIARAVNKLGIDWDNEILWDCYGAPYLPQWEQNGEVSISATEDNKMRLCLAVVHNYTIKGIGLDLGMEAEFAYMAKTAAYQAGNLFTDDETSGLQKLSQSAIRQRLICLFTAKEAAFKSMNRLIRTKFSEERETSFYAQLCDFEIHKGNQNIDYAVARGKTQKTAEYLGIQLIDIITVAEGGFALSAGICR